MLSRLIEEINNQGKSLKKFSNEWNVMQQLIDIVSFEPDCAEIVWQDIQIKEMNLKSLISKITAKHMANPYEIVEVICQFYGIDCPEELPPEVWRSKENKSGDSDSTNITNEHISLIDLI